MTVDERTLGSRYDMRTYCLSELSLLSGNRIPLGKPSYSVRPADRALTIRGFCWSRSIGSTPTSTTSTARASVGARLPREVSPQTDQAWWNWGLLDGWGTPEF